jgi:hypothetical protein
MADLYGLPATISDLDPGPVDDGGRLHVLEVMGIMDMPSFVIGRAKDSIGIWKRLRVSQETWAAGRAGGIEVVTGLPRSLLDIFAGMLDNDKDYTERKFLEWPGEIGNYLQCHLWECCRLSGVLELRRRQRRRRLKAKRPPAIDGLAPPPDNEQPPSELVMCRLMAAMDALYGAAGLPRNSHLLVQNGMIYPLFTASLEVAQLRVHPEWKATLREIWRDFGRRDEFSLTNATFALVEDCWAESFDYCDVDDAARQRNLEVALF